MTNELLDTLMAAAAIEKVAAYRVNTNESESHSWAYYADETESWWLVTSDELVTLASEYDLDVTKWAENVESTAIEYGKRAPRRAS